MVLKFVLLWSIILLWDIICGGLPFPGTGCPIPDVDYLCLLCIDFYVWDAVSTFNHLPRMFLSTDFAFWITDWTCCHGPYLHAILRIISRGVSGLATDSPCGVWGRGWTTCLLHDSPLFGSHFKMRVGMYVWSDISYIYYFLPLFTVSRMKPMIFLLCNNLFIYQVLCTLIYRRRSLYSFLYDRWLYPSHTGRRPRRDLQNRPDRRWSPQGRCEISQSAVAALQIAVRFPRSPRSPPSFEHAQNKRSEVAAETGRRSIAANTP